MLFNLMPYFTASSDKNLLIRSPTLAFVIHIYVIYAFITRTNVSFNFSFPINSAKRKFPLTLRINTEQKFRYDHVRQKRETYSPICESNNRFTTFPSSYIPFTFDPRVESRESHCFSTQLVPRSEHHGCFTASLGG